MITGQVHVPEHTSKNIVPEAMHWEPDITLAQPDEHPTPSSDPSSQISDPTQ